MAHHNPTLLHVQQAGQAVSTARQQVTLQLQHQVAKLASVVAAQPFGPDSDRAYARLRAVARTAQALQSIEDQLMQVYQTAAQFEEAQDIQGLVALPRHAPKAASANSEHVQDAQEVSPRPHTAKRAPDKQAVASRKLATPMKSSPTGQSNASRSNEERLLVVLRQHLKRRVWTPMTQAQMAEVSGLPRGSVGAALSRVIASGRVNVGERGQYRLT